MNHSLPIFLPLTLLFLFANVYAELSVEIDKDTVSPINDPINIRVKLDYVPQDNFVYAQIVNSMGNSVLEGYLPVDQNGEFNIVFAGDPFSNIPPISEGIYVIKIVGIKNNNTITDTNFFMLHTKQPSSEQTKKNSEQNGGCLIATATFGSELSPQVQNLREIRDNVVLKTNSGRLFMTYFNEIYYSFSPTVADLEKENRFLKETIKIGITPLLYTLSLLNIDTTISEYELIFYGVIIIGMNIVIYFLIPPFLIMKLKTYIINRINSKSSN